MVLSYFKNMFSNKVFFYLSSRYAIFFLQFVVSLLLSVRLGPYYLGVWGVYLVIHNYYYRLNLGIPYSSQVMLLQSATDKQRCSLIYFNALVVTGCLILLALVSTIFFWKTLCYVFGEIWHHLAVVCTGGYRLC